MLPVKNETELQGKLAEAGEHVVVVDFWAEWCGPCKILGPKLHELMLEYPGVQFITVNVDEGEAIADKYSVIAMPTFIIFWYLYRVWTDSLNFMFLDPFLGEFKKKN